MSNWGIKSRYKFDTSTYGSEWEGCYIDFKAISYNSLKTFNELDADKAQKDAEYAMEQTDTILELMKDNFIEGKIYDGKKVVTMKKADFDEIPMQVMNELISFLASTQSNG